MILPRFTFIQLVLTGTVVLSLALSGNACCQESTVQKSGTPPGIRVIHRISITGNKITRPRIITREMKFREQDTLSVRDFEAALVISRQNIFNTGLFNFVTVDTAVVDSAGHVDVKVSVLERWYIWPIPLLEISERNFNVWWQTRDFSKLTYGMDFTINNMRGRNETLRLLAHFGYNQLYGFTYKIPYVNRNQTIGLGLGGGIELHHELAVETKKNQPVNQKDSSAYLKKILYGYAEMQLRPSFHSTHTFRLSYNYYVFGGDIVAIPGFSLVSSSHQQFVSLSYYFRNDHRDVAYFPLTGYCIDLEVNHSIPYATAHNSYIKGNFRKYWKLTGRVFYGTGILGKVSFEKTQPYYLQRGLGFGQDFVRGYEYYVVDGQQVALWKNDLRFALVSPRVVKIGFIKTTKFNTIPFAVYIDLFSDIGYVYNYQQHLPEFSAQGNTLQNQLLGGVGLGLNLTTYYDIVIRFEGSMNRMGQTGFFLHFTAPI
ncbi:MAG: BamA/TamA family outer membrane protein [Bacteroidota bacterium]